MASKHENEKGINTCCPTCKIQSTMTKQISGLAILAKMTEVEELRKVPIQVNIKSLMQYYYNEGEKLCTDICCIMQI